MAVVVAEGTVTADGTEQTLLDSSLLATFQAHVSLINMAGGDTVVIRIKSKIGSLGTLRTVYEATFSGAQTGANLLQIGPPLPSGWQYVLTIQQTAGVNRQYLYRVDSLGSLTVAGSGTQALSSIAETSVFSSGSDGTYVFVADLGAVQAAENMTLRLKEPIEAAGTHRTAFEYVSPTGVQVSPAIFMASLPLSAPYGVSATMQQNHTNARNYPYAVYKVAA